VLASASSVMSVPCRRSNDDITQLPELTSGRAWENTESSSLLGLTHRPFGVSALMRHWWHRRRFDSGHRYLAQVVSPDREVSEPGPGLQRCSLDSRSIAERPRFAPAKSASPTVAHRWPPDMDSSR
jgi:hypothetical protein